MRTRWRPPQLKLSYTPSENDIKRTNAAEIAGFQMYSFFLVMVVLVKDFVAESHV